MDKSRRRPATVQVDPRQDECAHASSPPRHVGEPSVRAASVSRADRHPSRGRLPRPSRARASRGRWLRTTVTLCTGLPPRRGCGRPVRSLGSSARQRPGAERPAASAPRRSPGFDSPPSAGPNRPARTELLGYTLCRGLAPSSGCPTLARR